MAFDLHSGKIGKFSLMTFYYQVGASGGMLNQTETTFTGGRESQFIASQSHSQDFRLLVNRRVRYK